MIRRRTVRLVLAAVVVLSAASVGASWATRATTTEAPPGDGVTVVTQQGRDKLEGTARLLAFAEDGSVLYEHDDYDAYFDVDPVEGTTRTVEFVGVDFQKPERCPDRLADAGNWCARNVVVRLNLTTGHRSVVFQRYLPKLHKLHDVDRINETHLVVANIYRDRVEFVDTTTGNVTWAWSANESFDHPDSGGAPGDWTHVNDVEVVRDGWVMVSMRNHDQVVFLDPARGLVEAWTLGCDDCHDVLFEHHNPDYLPGERPVVLVADSENDRVVEYRREGAGWERTWTWTSAETAWPRDADRLPNGNTLVTDSHANRVVEVTPGGRVVWSVTLGNPYEAERLGTGDESAGGAPHEPGTQVETGGPVGYLVVTVRNLLPSKPLSAALWVAPYWVEIPEIVTVGIGLVGAAVLVVLEVGWFLRGRHLSQPSDVRSIAGTLRFW